MIHTWNEDDDAFDQQLETWSVEKLFPDQPKPVTRGLRAYIEDLGEFSLDKNDQRTYTHFLEKYRRLSVYAINIEKIY